jgi:fructose-specific phosphotransferase system IIC component
VRHRIGVDVLRLTSLSLLLPSVVFGTILLALSAFELAESLAGGSRDTLRLFVRRVVETGSGLLLEGNVGHVVY